MEREEPEVLERRFEKPKTELSSLRDEVAKLKKEKKDLEKVLGKRERLFHSVPAGILLIQQERIVEINETALAQLGCTPEEVIGHDFLDFVHPDRRALVRDFYRKRNTGKAAPDLYETELITRDRRTLCCEVMVNRVRHEGRFALIATLIPLDRRKEKEREALHSGKIEALVTMASGLFDEYGPCLATIAENSKRLRAIPGLGDAVLECLRNIAHASDKALLMTAMLDCLARRKNDQNNLALFNLKEVIEEAAALAGQEWKEGRDRNGSPIHIKTYLRSAPQIEGDPDEIREALLQIIANAVNALPHGGDVLITSEGNAGYAHVYVQDSGVGIAEYAKDRIFDPFYTADGRGGTGLGLSLAYAIIKRHGGEIEVASQKDQGASFDIKLPVSKMKTRSGICTAKKRIREASILIIEGDDFTGALLAQLLKSKGCSVVSASSRPEGLGRLKKKKFDLLVSEAPVLDLHEAGFVRQIREIDQDLPVALIRNQDGGRGGGSRRRSAADLTIWKPVDLNKAVKEISALLTGRNQ